MSGIFNVIDHAIFERMQQSCSNKSISTNGARIRNSKYKRMSSTHNFNIMHFVKTRRQVHCLKKNGKMRRRIEESCIVGIKNKGKKRENVKKKKPTRLKKSILQYRRKKRELEQLDKLVENTENNLQKLNIDENENKRKTIPGIHTRGFREYCNCCKTSDLKKYCEQIIRELNHFQRRAYNQNEIKARAHKRFVVGFRQVQASLRINKIKLVIIATDCEQNEGGDTNVGLDEIIDSIKKTCNDQKIPVVFAFRRREMAYFLHRKASISCIGIFDYDGARELFSQLVEALKTAREMYESLLDQSR